jgi:hypothetical protein
MDWTVALGVGVPGGAWPWAVCATRRGKSAARITILPVVNLPGIMGALFSCRVRRAFPFGTNLPEKGTAGDRRALRGGRAGGTERATW